MYVGDSIGVSVGVGRSFVVDGARIKGADSFVSVEEVIAGSALVAQRPEDDARVVTVAQDHAFCAIQHSRLPTGLAGDDLRVVAAI